MEIVFLRQAHKFIVKADKPLRDKIKEEVLRIGADPKIGKFLQGELKKIRSYGFFYEKISYRIAYTVKDNLIVILIASRENFYKDLVN